MHVNHVMVERSDPRTNLKLNHFLPSPCLPSEGKKKGQGLFFFSFFLFYRLSFLTWISFISIVDSAADLFPCNLNVDIVSVRQIVDMVSMINYSIDNMVMNILYRVKKSDLAFCLSPAFLQDTLSTKQEPEPFTLPHFLLDPQLSTNAKDAVVECFLKDRVFSLIYQSYFEGENFYGVGSNILRYYLESMLSILVEQGKPLSPPFILFYFNF